MRCYLTIGFVRLHVYPYSGIVMYIILSCIAYSRFVYDFQGCLLLLLRHYIRRFFYYDTVSVFYSAID